jgi:hypothetical protein
MLSVLGGEMIAQILMIAVGLAVVAAGFWGTFNAKKPWNTIAALSLPIGLITALIGVLLLCVPDFFKG